MYHKPEKFEVLVKGWLAERLEQWEVMGKNERKELFKKPSKFIGELFEDMQNLIEWKEATK